MRIFLLISSLLVTWTPSVRADQQEADCSLCVAIVGAIEEFILNGDTMDDILNNIEGICSSFGALQGLCEAFLENNLPGIIEGKKEVKCSLSLVIVFCVLFRNYREQSGTVRCLLIHRVLQLN